MNTSIYILHLETSTKVCSVALSKNGALVAVKESQEDNFMHGEYLTLCIQDVLSQSNLSLSEIHAVSVSSGPGSYTGLRIGVSTAKGLCFALKIPLISIDSLQVLKEIAVKKYPSSNIVCAIDARRMEVFSAIYNSRKDVLKPISADVLMEDTYKEFEPFLFVGDASSKMENFWKEREKIAFDNTIFSSAVGHIEFVYSKYLKDEFESVAYFEPFYLKDFLVVQSTKKHL
jgi:tRNA threonylcarbamoyladenosine biosynthesis protein TsaB